MKLQVQTLLIILLLTFAGHAVRSWRGVWSLDMQRIASSDDNGVVKIWDRFAHVVRIDVPQIEMKLPKCRGGVLPWCSSHETR